MRYIQRITVYILVFVFLITSNCNTICFAKNDKDLNVYFTHDIHDYLSPTKIIEYGKEIEHGGAARLATVINENKDENSIFLDAGDFSMGTLFQASYCTEAYELRNLGLCGCEVTTFGNHEFDFGTKGVARMLRAAKKSGDKLPIIVQSNIDFSGELNEEQKDLQKAFEEYGVKENTIIERAGHKIGIFGVVGLNCISYMQTDLNYKNYIEAAKEQTEKLKDAGCDIIIALSHSGTNDDGKTGEDVDMAKKVDGIDIIISGHTHSTYEEPIKVNDTSIVSDGEYLKNVGKMTITKENDKANVTDYKLFPINSSIKEDSETKKRIDEYKENINKTYLKDGETFDKVIAHSDFNAMDLKEMYDNHVEFPMGDLIADSYMYEAKKNGIDDVDCAFVGLGTIRGAIMKGDITIANAFEICSLGVGFDGTAGHDLVAVYFSGEEMKLISELDASIGSSNSSVRMSYSGLNYTFNTKRILLDRVTDVNLVDKSGKKVKFEDDKLYKVIINMYSANMLGMVNDLTKGILPVIAKDANGNPIKDYSKAALLDKNGDAIKEWIAFKDYLESFEVGESGYPTVPLKYEKEQARKVKISKFGLECIFKFGVGTKVVPIVIFALIDIILLIIMIIVVKKRKKRYVIYIAKNYDEDIKEAC